LLTLASPAGLVLLALAARLRQNTLIRNHAPQRRSLATPRSIPMSNEAASLKRVVIYTDGGALGNPGPGGYGCVLRYGDRVKELSAGFRLTTNNRMELLGAITALATLTERCHVTLHTDSQYVVNGIEKGWAAKWRSQGWMRTRTDRALNADLWAELLAQCDRHHVSFKWVRGHSGVADNERCDQLVQAAARGRDHGIDEAYEREQR
jgi:ribonuclease HI